MEWLNLLNPGLKIGGIMPWDSRNSHFEVNPGGVQTRLGKIEDAHFFN